MRKVREVFKARTPHWVGDGFYVNSVFHHLSDRFKTDPFLMLDYAAPQYYKPREEALRGVGEHPHKGFETVTIAYHGEVAHRDSSGGGGVIKPGDVQWMTAGAGVVHQEFHSKEFSARGGLFEMVQLWVNLPAKFKNTPPRYQHLAKDSIPVLSLANGAGSARIIAGDFMGAKGAAMTFSPMDVIDVALNEGGKMSFKSKSDYSLSVVVLSGTVSVNDGETKASNAELVSFESGEGEVRLEALGSEAKLLILAGKPLNEPVVGYGPFVMNSEEEIAQAIEDYRAGRFGEIVQG
ncbi:pirin family protein [Campylobacter sp. 19-13652]|uniref:pirin family protein n=1 Tax=Campylobacter sp. 19-13652 TaxID=2840180 RepID=UPI001C74884C|nr:pirin family protein [Campylobacter sp. 19-13652]BCX78598.1 quercetin 2,3-dioxygenase [Campylobacter sp. 19-13652]